MFCHVEFIACAYLLRAKRLSPFSFRSPIYRDYFTWIENYLREYTKSMINIIQVSILKVIGVNNLSKLSNIFNQFYKHFNFYIKRVVLHEKKNNKYTNNTNEFLKKGEIRTSNLLHSAQTLFHLSFFERYDFPFKFNRWTGKCVLFWDESLNLNPALDPLVTWH